jgi:hypothetical protein
LRAVLRTAVLAFCATGSATVALGQEAEDNTGIDWSVGLRGSYASNTVTGGQWALSVTPEAALKIGGESSRSSFSAGAELIYETDVGMARLADFHAAAESSYRFDALTVLSGSIRGALTQANPNSTSLPTNTLHAPLVFEGVATGTATRDFDKIDLTGTLEGRRYMRGNTTLDDLSIVDNSSASYWQGGGTLRVGYELTPLISAFLEGEASAQKFDAPSPTLLKYLDGRTYQLRAGLGYTQGSIIAAEASIGRAWLDYFDSALTDAPSWVYNGSLTLRPDETVELTGALETTLGPSEDTPGDTDVGYALTAAARYIVNPWLTLRSSAGWDQTVTLGTSAVSWGYDAAAGLDLRTSRYVVWTADYGFSRDYAPPAPLSDTHRVTLGMRVQR